MALLLAWAELHKVELAEDWERVRAGEPLYRIPPLEYWRMDYDVVEARHVRDHVFWLRFRDGTSGEVDLAAELHGTVFEPLRDAHFFKQFWVHPELDTLVWPNGADFAPEFLHQAVQLAGS